MKYSSATNERLTVRRTGKRIKNIRKKLVFLSSSYHIQTLAKVISDFSLSKEFSIQEMDAL
jgi:hypothetical protein